VRPTTLARAGVASELARTSSVEVVAADLADRTAVARATEGVDVVFHLAWQWKRKQSSVSESDPGDGADSERANVNAVERNLDAANRLLAASTASGVHRFVFTSSVAVYGHPAAIRRFPIAEDA